MKEYRLAKGWAWFLYLVGPPIIVLFGWLLTIPFEKEEPEWGTFFILTPIALGMIALFVLAFIDVRKGKFVIDQDRVYSISVFGNRSLLLEEIKGYRTDDKYIYIEPKEKGKRKVKISNYYSKTEEIIEWLDMYYPDLNALAVQEEEAAILQDVELGRTVEEREEKLNFARKMATGLNIAGGIVAAWGIFWPQPYEYAMLASVLVFAIVVAALKFYGKLIRIGFSNTTAYPSPAFGFLGPASALGIRALFDYELYDYTPLWTIFLVSTLLLTIILLIGSKEFTFKKSTDYWMCLVFLLFAAEFSYGSIVFVNCYYDSSEFNTYTATIEDKRISSGKHTTYYLELSPWATRTSPEEVSVSKEMYEAVETNDEVDVYLGKGELGIPWFYVSN